MAIANSSTRILRDRDDLILEILSRLPVESLMRFRCVSKTWNSIILNPDLVKSHLKKSSKNPQILLLEKKIEERQCFSAVLSSLPCLIQNPTSSSAGRILRCPKPYKYLFGSCNGLLSLHCSLSTYECEEHMVCFLNPATKTCSLPSPSLRLNYGIGVQYDMNFGFGYDDWRDSYKVVAMVLDWSTHQTSVWVYCMGDVRWRLTIMTSPAFLTIDSNGYFLNGTVNWLGHSSKESKLQIFSYDLKNDTNRYLSVPELVPKDSEFNSMGILNDCLCVSFDERRTVFVVLTLKDTGDDRSWSQLMSVSYETLNISPYYDYLRTLCMWGDLLLLTYSQLWDDYDIIIIFNLKENKVERTQAYYKHSLSHIFSCHYVPSLI
ncbi:F-box/kelch-repeat protein At3g23880 [Vigna angularis]|uniref:F-box/kelch-repeat protein At3g23880 n=1 Tax=Phaseolus angularis TaxID=3914 RepID=UPI0022B40E92|nr:F-box/kelch-repeat protein At3g23880 [Vigna angularis]